MTTTRTILSLKKPIRNQSDYSNSKIWPHIVGVKQKERADKLCDRLTGSIHFSQLRANHA